MAPLPYLDTLDRHTVFERSKSTPHRPFAPDFTAWLVILSIFFTALLATACFTTYRITKSMQPEVAIASTTTTRIRKSSVSTVANSSGTRKDSNILWSAYFSEDDLKFHFDRKPSQMSHVFSVGTLESDICPLERDATDILPPTPHLSAADVRNQAPYASETAPTKILRMETTAFAANFENINIKDFGSDKNRIINKAAGSQEMLN